MILLSLFSVTAQADLASDYFSGKLDTAEMLDINPDVIAYNGPMAGQFFSNGLDYGWGYTPGLPNSVALHETEFLSFELNTGSVFTDPYVHFVAALRGHSFVPSTLRGRGLAIGNTPGCIGGIQIEDFTVSAVGGGSGYYLKGCNPFNFANNSNYRIDIHASYGVVAYWVFRENPSILQQLYGMNKWTLMTSGGCGVPPHTACAQHPNDLNAQNVVLGTAGRNNSQTYFFMKNIYVAKF